VALMINRRTILTLMAGSALALPHMALAAAPRTPPGQGGTPPGQAGNQGGPGGGGGKEKHHNNGKDLIGDIKVNGNHKLGKAGKIDVSADVQGGKVVGFHAKHPDKGDLAIHKVKSTTKFALLEQKVPGSALVQDAGVVTVWYYAYWFTDEFGNDWYYWWPVDYIIDDGSWIIYSA